MKAMKQKPAITRLPGESLDVFEIHRDIMDDYKQFVGSFIKIRDNAIKYKVDKDIADGKFWPEPLIGFNPSFEKGETLNDLCNQGIVHPQLTEIFKGFTLYKHQAEAIAIRYLGLDLSANAPAYGRKPPAK